MAPPAASPFLIPANPYGRDAEWQEQRRRRRLMTGDWLTDLTRRLVREVGAERTDAWGVPQQTSNIFATINREMSALYLAPFVTRTPDGTRLAQADAGPIAEFGRALTRSAFAARMIEFQPLVLGCQEYLWRVHVFDGGRIGLRPVPPDVVDAEPDQDDPSQLYRVRELRWRPQVKAWCWDVLCAAEREYRVVRYDAEGVTTEVNGWQHPEARGADVTEAVLGRNLSGADYPYLSPAGDPILPYELYHASALGDQLWHPTRGIESVEGALTIAVMLCFLNHVVKSASWPQRYAVNALLAGAEVGGTMYDGIQIEGIAQTFQIGGPGREKVITDPALLLQFVQDPNSPGQPVIGQFLSSADPVAMETVISAIANRVAVEAGLPASDIQRMGGTARSGYAISLSNEGKRVTARRYAPAFRDPDSRMLGKMAALWSTSTGQPLPSGRWDAEYQDLPLSPDEMRERRANVIETMDAGLLSRVNGYAELNPGIDRPQALADLAAIDAERAQKAAQVAAATSALALATARSGV